MSELDAVLFANEAFYLAFANRDLAAMEEVWARGHSVACVHPGWQPLSGREEVMEAWTGILANSEAPRVSCRAPRVYLSGETAFVVCFEVIGKGALVATNIFCREGGLWKMIHHQAGPCNARAGDLPKEAPPEPMQ
ncbi:MAG: nuclear transport factor 2 family protein [Rhodovibrionaceae bacterium]